MLKKTWGYLLDHAAGTYEVYTIPPEMRDYYTQNAETGTVGYPTREAAEEAAGACFPTVWAIYRTMETGREYFYAIPQRFGNFRGSMMSPDDYIEDYSTEAQARAAVERYNAGIFSWSP